MPVYWLRKQHAVCKHFGPRRLALLRLKGVLVDGDYDLTDSEDGIPLDVAWYIMHMDIHTDDYTKVFVD